MREAEIHACAGCGKPISGTAVVALESAWHPGCFRCTGCGRSIGQGPFRVHEAVPYHEECYHRRFSPRCFSCGTPVTRRAVNALGKTWHREHFLCAQCRAPFDGRGFYERDGRAYCERDFHELFSPRCAICGDAIREVYLTNSWGEVFCRRHQAEFPQCYSCSRLICERLTGGGRRYEDGRTMCNRCRRTAVDSAEEGQDALEEVRATLADLGFDLGDVAIPLKLADQLELDECARTGYVRHPTGLARTRFWTQHGVVVRREVEEILVLRSLPREHFAAVAAHELGHAWLFLNAFPTLPPLVEEGVCELCEYLWLGTQQTAEADYRRRLIESNPDPVYGAGFREARNVVERWGLATLSSYLCQHGDFPA